jgi:hypothetical protein
VDEVWIPSWLTEYFRQLTCEQGATGCEPLSEDVQRRLSGEIAGYDVRFIDEWPGPRPLGSKTKRITP